MEENVITNEDDYIKNEEKDFKEKVLSSSPKELAINGTEDIIDTPFEEIKYSFWDIVDSKLEDIVDEYEEEIIKILKEEGRI